MFFTAFFFSSFTLHFSLLFTICDLPFTIYPQMNFRLQSTYQPKGDQPQAIEALVRGLSEGLKDQVLLGITGSGKIGRASCRERV